MPHSALTPVFTGLRTGLHALTLGLTLLVVVRAVLVPTAASLSAIIVAAVLIATYALGAVIARARQRPLTALWVALLTAEWIGLVWLTPDAAYLVFPLCFLYLHLLGRGWGTAVVCISTAIAIVALGVHIGWSVGGVVGPIVGAGVALLIGLGYQALAREAVEREQLMHDLLATRGQLAATEHEAGVLAERARLAREIHDTVAQGLSSIQLLLHAAERADPDRPGIEHVRLARDTAVENLAEARRFIRELTPPALEEQGLGGALRRLASTHWAAQGLTVSVQVSDEVHLPMHVQTALLRIAQGAIANVIQHARAERATIALTTAGSSVQLRISDAGTGFDVRSAPTGAARSDSFGLQAIRERVDQLGGVLTLDSEPGKGAALTVDLTLDGGQS